MNTAEERKAFRKRARDLTQKELFQWSFLAALAQRIDSELACYQALFGDGEASSGQETFAADTQLAGIQLMLQQETRRRSAAPKTRRQIQKEGEESHANHAQNGE